MSADGVRQSIDDLERIRHLYAAHGAPHFFAAALDLLRGAFECPAGWVWLMPAGDATVRLGASVPAGRLVALPADRTPLEPIFEDPRPRAAAAETLPGGEGLVALGCGAALMLCAPHGGLATSVWAVGRAAPFAGEDLRRAAVFADNLEHAGAVALRCGALVGEGPLPPRDLLVRAPSSASASRSTRVSGLFGAGLIPDAAIDGMAARTTACACLAARGYTNDEIATVLHVSTSTVARELRQAYRALGIAGRSELDVAALLALPKPV